MPIAVRHLLPRLPCHACGFALAGTTVETLKPAQAMVLAAGRGERMRPLTDAVPKPLLCIAQRELLLWQLQALARGGVGKVVINTDWLGEQISARFGHQLVSRDPAPAGQSPAPDEVQAMQLQYSNEGRDFGHALETAGGIARALPQLTDPFWALAGDIFAPEFVFSLARTERFAASDKLAHVWLVPNPPHHPLGDFGLGPQPECDEPRVRLALAHATEQYTFSAIGLYRKALFAPPYCSIAAGNPGGSSARLAPILRAAMADGLVSAEIYTGMWADVGTPQRLAELNLMVAPPPT